MVNAATDLVHDALRDLEQMFFVTKLDRRNLELSLFFDIGLQRAINHDIGNVRIAEQLFKRTKAEQFVDEHFFQSKLFAAVKRQLEFGQHFKNDRAEFFGQLFFIQRCRRFGVHTLQKARENLFFDFVYRRFKALGAFIDWCRVVCTV